MIGLILMTDPSFGALPLCSILQTTLQNKGYHRPTPIQWAAIPPILEGKDFLGVAQTGTGKTAAFALPILQLLALPPVKSRRFLRALVLTPTRELAAQVRDSFHIYGKNCPLRTALVHGGVSQRPQEKALAAGPDILVATPGRLLDLLEQGHVDLSGLSILVLDEADRMLDMGFLPDLRRILKAIPTQRQTLFFSATMPPEVSNLAESLLRHPVKAVVSPIASTADKVDQKICFVAAENKRHLLLDLLLAQQRNPGRQLSLIFSRTKSGANRLALELQRAGMGAEAIHGNKSQSARTRTLDLFRQGKVAVLVATDLAARGLDVKDIKLVVNYDLPEEAASYVHRIGRTARAGAEGLAYSFCGRDELALLRNVERTIQMKIPVYREHAYHREDFLTAASLPTTSNPWRRSFSKAGRRHRPPASRFRQR